MSGIEYEVEGTKHKAERRKQGAVEVVLVDGRVVELDIVERGPGHLRVRRNGHVLDVRVIRHDREYWVGLPGRTVRLLPADHVGSSAAAGTHGPILSPITGRVIQVMVAEGAAVEARQPLAIIEAMKMENEVLATVAGVVRDVRIQAGENVIQGAAIMQIEAADPGE
jgi:biotin carboxyl carrier protein